MSIVSENVIPQSYNFLNGRNESDSFIVEKCVDNDSCEVQSTMSIQEHLQSCHIYKKKMMKFIIFTICLLLVIWTTVSIVIINKINPSNSEIKTVGTLVPSTSSMFQPTLSKDNLSRDLINSLVITTNDNEIRLIDPMHNEHNLIRKTQNKILALDIYTNETLLWIEQNSTKIESFTNNTFTEIYIGPMKPTAIAIDMINHKLYVVDESAEILNVVDLIFKYQAVILSDLKSPHDIVLDPVQGIMFIVQLHDSILRANMDGTSAVEILEKKNVSAIAINRMLKRIYWANAFTAIESVDYDGTNPITLTTSVSNIFSMAIFNNQLFWLCPSHGINQTVIFSCTIEKEKCMNLTRPEIELKSHIIRTAQEHLTLPFDNPCNKENGECEQLCLLTEDGKHNCACKIGWQLHSDRKNCIKISSILIYAQGDYFRGRTLNLSFKDVILPIKYSAKVLKNKDSIDFDIGNEVDEIIFSDDQSIYKLNITDGKQIKIYQVNKDYYIKELSFNKLTNVIYFFKMSKLTNNHSLQAIVQKENSVYYKTIATLSYPKEDTGLISNSLATLKYIFFTLRTTTNEIKLILLSGNGTITHYETLPNENHKGIIAIDYSDSSKYWIYEDTNYYLKIKRITEDGDITYFHVYMDISDLKNMIVHDKWIYFCSSFKIMRVSKIDGGDMLGVVTRMSGKNNHMIHGVRVLDFNLKFNEKSSQCRKNNGGCERFCFIDGDNKVCSCDDGLRIYDDERCR